MSDSDPQKSMTEGPAGGPETKVVAKVGKRRWLWYGASLALVLVLGAGVWVLGLDAILGADRLSAKEKAERTEMGERVQTVGAEELKGFGPVQLLEGMAPLRKVCSWPDDWVEMGTWPEDEVMEAHRTAGYFCGSRDFVVRATRARHGQELLPAGWNLELCAVALQEYLKDRPAARDSPAPFFTYLALMDYAEMSPGDQLKIAKIKRSLGFDDMSLDWHTVAYVRNGLAELEGLRQPEARDMPTLPDRERIRAVDARAYFHACLQAAGGEAVLSKRDLPVKEGTTFDNLAAEFLEFAELYPRRVNEPAADLIYEMLWPTGDPYGPLPIGSPLTIESIFPKEEGLTGYRIWNLRTQLVLLRQWKWEEAEAAKDESLEAQVRRQLFLNPDSELEEEEPLPPLSEREVLLGNRAAGYLTGCLDLTRLMWSQKTGQYALIEMTLLDHPMVTFAELAMMERLTGGNTKTVSERPAADAVWESLNDFEHLEDYSKDDLMRRWRMTDPKIPLTVLTAGTLRDALERLDMADRKQDLTEAITPVEALRESIFARAYLEGCAMMLRQEAVETNQDHQIWDELVYEDLVNAFLRYEQAHPDQRDEPAATVVYDALNTQAKKE